MLAVVVLASSASHVKRSSLLSDASHNAAAALRVFARQKLLPLQDVKRNLDYRRRQALAAGLYVVLNRDHLSILTEGPQRDVLQAGSYDKNKNPPPRRREKHDKLKTLKNPRKKKTCNNDSGGVAGAGHVIDTCGPSYCTKTKRL
jgi:hypothetical protein